MALIVADRVKETTTTTGTGTLSLAGAVAGFQSFVAGVGTTNTTYYAITDSATGDWEVGIGTVTSGTPDTLSRDTVLESSNSDNLVNFGAGQKIVICTQPAEKAVYLNAAGNLDVAGDIDMGTNTITDAKVGQWDTAYGWGDHAVEGYLTGNQTITLSGDVSGAGTTNIIVTVADDSHNHVISNIDSLQTTLDSKLPLAGGTLTGFLTLHADPTNALHAATKEYVDTIASASLHYHDPVRVESPVNLTATYNNGTSGVGATLTNAGTQAALVIDGVTLSLNDRVLIYQQTDATQNGVYYVSDVGSGSTNWVLTRTTDTDSYGASDPNALGTGDAFFVTEGNTGAGELYVMNTEGAITFGTTNIMFSQISSAQIYSAGAGLDLTGTVFSHTDTSSQASVNNSNGTVIQDITLDTFGHITALGSVDLDGRYYTETEVGNFFNGTTAITGYNKSNWDTAYGWGNHAAAGYQPSATALTTSTTFGGDVSGTYNAIVVADDSHNHIISNVDGLQTALDSKQAAATALTTSTTFGGDVSGTYNAIVVANDSHTHDTRYYTETEIGSFFGGTTAITGYNKSNWDTAHGWGNHASAGYLTGNQTITLTGDVSGSGTTSISVTVANDSHTHDTRYYTETESDNRYIIKGTGYEWTAVGTNALTFRSLDVMETATGDQASLEVFQDTVGADAFMQFHVGGDFAAYFGLKGDINDFAVGGWSMGNNYYRVFHDNYHPNADKWTTARTLSLSGDASGSVSWDGSANATLTVTVADNSHSHSISTITDEDRLFNNMGNNHGTYTDFNAVPNFGTYYLQQGTNGPTGVTAHQWYGFTLGLGNEYTLAQYASQLYWPRAAQNGSTYLYVRDRENTVWGSWRKILAGYADTAGNANTASSSPLLSALANYVWTGSTLPTGYSQGIQCSFVQSANGFPNYGSLMTMNTYSGGGGALQLYVPYSPTYGGTGLQVRFGNYDVSGGNSWTSWKTLLASDNFNSYAPSLTGSGASGTWGISITGNAATASKWATARTITLNGDATGSVSLDGSANVTLTVAVADNSHNHPYLPLSGGTLTGAVSFSADTTDVLDFTANATNDGRGISFNGRTALSADFNDGWLRLNNASEFTNGTYSPSKIASASQLLGGGSSVSSGGQIALTAATNPYLSFHESGTRRGYIQYLTSTNEMFYYNEESSDHRFQSNTTTVALQLCTSGGTTRGFLYADAFNTIGFLDSDGQWAYRHTRDVQHEWRINNVAEMLLEADGDLHVGGDVIAFSTTVSDRRLKDNIKNIENALDKVDKINGVTFLRKQNGQESAGVIAQEIMEVLPEAVKEKSLPLHTKESDEKYYVVEYDAVTGLLVEAIKELKARVEALEAT